MEWRTVALARSAQLADGDGRLRGSLDALLAARCAAPAALPLCALFALVCAAGAASVLGALAGLLLGAAVALACVGADAALLERRKRTLLDRRVAGEAVGCELLDGLSAAELEWLEGSQGQQLGQIRVNPALMTGAILRERICRSSQLIALPEPQRFELFLGAPPLRMAPEHAIGVYCPPGKSTDDIQVQLCLQLGPAGPSPNPSAEPAVEPAAASSQLVADYADGSVLLSPSQSPSPLEPPLDPPTEPELVAAPVTPTKPPRMAMSGDQAAKLREMLVSISPQSSAGSPRPSSYDSPGSAGVSFEDARKMRSMLVEALSPVAAEAS